jgi:N-acetylmuramoyl-L-alanine amidase
MPAALVECEFVSSPKQLRFLAKAENQRGLAQAIADGLPPPVVT